MGLRCFYILDCIKKCLINNYMEGLTGTIWDAPITLTLGDAIDGQSSSLSKHFRAERVTIAYNTLVNNSHGIEIGYDNNNNYKKDLKDIIIANNLITGSENSLVEIIDTDNDQGDNITWLNNLMYPTDNATILKGATSTSFDANAVTNENPYLDFDNTLGLWTTTENTPLYENAVMIASVGDDIQGQDRPTMSNPGADHYSMETIRYSPLTPDDVGPNSSGTNTTSTFGDYQEEDLLIYPVPVDNILRLKNSNLNVNRIEMVNLVGTNVLTRQFERPFQEVMLNISNLQNGIYVLKFSNDDTFIGSRKIIVQHD